MGEHIARYASFRSRIYHLHSKMHLSINFSIKAQLVQMNCPIKRVEEPEMGKAGLRMTLYCPYFAFPWEKYRVSKVHFFLVEDLCVTWSQKTSFPLQGWSSRTMTLHYWRFIRSSNSEPECFWWERYSSIWWN